MVLRKRPETEPFFDAEASLPQHFPDERFIWSDRSQKTFYRTLQGLSNDMQIYEICLEISELFACENGFKRCVRRKINSIAK